MLGLVAAKILHVILQNPIARARVTLVELAGVVTHLLRALWTEHLDQRLGVIFDEHLDIALSHLKVKLNSEESILEAEGLVPAKLAGGEQRVARRRRRRGWRRGIGRA